MEDAAGSEKPKKKRKDRRVECEYWDWVEATDPKTGETIRQKVKVTRFKTKGDRFSQTKTINPEEIATGSLESEDE